MFTKTHTRIGLAAVAAIFSLGAHAANVAFDPFGNSGANPAQTFQVNSLDWLPDNALAIAALSTPAYAGGPGGVAGQKVGESYIRTVAQGTLGTLGTTVGSIGTTFFNGFTTQSTFGREFTFQTSFYEFGTSIGSSTASFRLAPGANFFKVYADTSKNSDMIAGSGYGDGTLILEGTLTQLSGSFTDKTLTAGDPDFGRTTLLDGFNSDNQNGVKTHIGQGSNKILVDVTSLNPAYFLGNIAQIVLTLDYSDTSNLNAPFISANPSNQVVGVTPSYTVVGTDKINGAPCTASGGKDENGNQLGRCDFHFQSDASGSFQLSVVPEPGSLALIGVALASLGFATRKRKSV